MGKFVKPAALVMAGVIVGAGAVGGVAHASGFSGLENEHLKIKCMVAAQDACNLEIKTGQRAGYYRLKLNNGQIVQYISAFPNW